jgi:hypothetical protein
MEAKAGIQFIGLIVLSVCLFVGLGLSLTIAGVAVDSTPLIATGATILGLLLLCVGILTAKCR